MRKNASVQFQCVTKSLNKSHKNNLLQELTRIHGTVIFVDVKSESQRGGAKGDNQRVRMMVMFNLSDGSHLIPSCRVVRT